MKLSKLIFTMSLVFVFGLFTACETNSQEDGQLYEIGEPDTQGIDKKEIKERDT